MILALERSSFNYLYKYNQIKINPISVMELSGDSLQTIKFDEVLRQLDRALPVFEEDHELLLVEVNREAVQFNAFLTLRYSGITKVYPISSRGAQLLEGRLNQNINVEKPIFEKYIPELKVIRSLENRLLAARSLHGAFSITAKIKGTDFNAIKESTAAILRGVAPERFLFIHALIDYNLTPSFVPEGNLEYLIKVGMVAIKSMGKDEQNITLGPFYKVSIKELGRTVGKPLAETYERFWAIRDVEFQNSLTGVAQQAIAEHGNVDLFKVAYYFIAFRKLLQKNGHDLLLIGSEIKALVRHDQMVASWVLTLLGFSFSFENLYESLHKLEHKGLPEEKIIVVQKKQVDKKADKKMPEILSVGQQYDLDPVVTKQSLDASQETDGSKSLEEKRSAEPLDKDILESPSADEIPGSTEDLSGLAETNTIISDEKKETSTTGFSDNLTGIGLQNKDLEVKQGADQQKTAIVMRNFNQLMIEANTAFPHNNAKKYLKTLKDHFAEKTDISESDFSAFEMKYKKLKHENLSIYIHSRFQN